MWTQTSSLKRTDISMNLSIAVLISHFLMLLDSGLSRPPSAENIASHLKMLMQTTINRIKPLGIQVSGNITFEDQKFIPDPDQPVKGLKSTEEKLSVFQKILEHLPDRQIERDIFNLQSNIQQLAISMTCSTEKKESDKELDNFLSRNKPNHRTIRNITLDRLSRFLTKLKETYTHQQSITC